MNNQSFLSLWYVQALLALILVAVLTSLFAYTKLTLREAKYGQYGMTSIVVRGEGEVMARPDIGMFSFSVMAEAADAAGAQTQSAEKTNAILAFLEEAGVDEKDVKTSGYSLDPKYRYEEVVCTNMYCPPSNPVIDGYTVTQTVQVKVRELDKAGDLITGTGERGATNISGLSFTIDDPSNLKAEAREAAIADAKEKAQILADELGVRLVRIMSFYEEEGYPMPYGYGGDAMMMADKVESASVAPRMPTGESETKSTVSITFEVR